ncbi:MAG: TRAP transporter permease [Thermoanaerobacterales bacterium]|nr:TRAP transporter permease [Thermoanaerobacterales bacterium]
MFKWKRRKDDRPPCTASAGPLQASRESTDETAAGGSEVLDSDSRIVRLRSLKGPAGKIVFSLGLALTLFELYSLYIDPLDPWLFRSGHLVFASLLIFMLIPGSARSPRERVSLGDVVWMVLTVSTIVYMVVDFDGLLFRAGGGSPETLDIVFGGIAVLVVLEVMRRTSGIALPVIAVAFIAYAIIGPFLPGLFWHRGYSLERVISFLYSPVGIYTIPLGVSAQYVFIFILFGVFLQRSGAGDLFVNLGLALTGRTRGGLGKVPIVSSALFGTISGAAVANVVVDGSITIPAMKKAGFSPGMSGAIEAVASTGGQLMPPVMGAAAFLMAEVLGISYGSIVVAAVIPALLYYMSLYWMVDFQAAKTGLGSVKGGLPSLKKLIREQGHLLIPLVALIFVLVGMESTPNRAAIIAIALTLVASWLSKATRIGLRDIVEIFASAGRGIMEIAATTAGAGIVIGILSLTGLGLKAANIILAYAGDNLFLALFFSMIICLILGMGVPTVAAYATAAAVIPPALVQMGVPELAAHMFIFYFAILATITPPVAIASFAAAAIARASMWDVGWTALKVGLAGFIVPYMFVYSPALLAQGDPLHIGLAIVSALIGVTALAGAIQGWYCGTLNTVARVALFIAAMLLIKQGLTTDIIGYGIFILVTAMQIMSRKKPVGKAQAATSRSAPAQAGAE